MNLVGVFVFFGCVCSGRLAGGELGPATDLIFKKHNTKQGSGCVGCLTADTITRALYYER